MKFFQAFFVLLVATAALAQPHLGPRIDAQKLLNRLAFSTKVQQLAKTLEQHEKSARKPVENINDFVDLVIAETSASILRYGFDPMPLPPIEETIDVAGSDVLVQLNSGSIANTSVIYRNGDVNMYYGDRVLTVEVPIFFKQFQLQYEYDFFVGEEYTHYSGILNGEVFVVDVKFSVQVDFRDLKISLKSFDIPTLGAINVDFVGDMMPEIREAINQLLSSEFRKQIISTIETICNSILNAVFDIINKILGSIKP